MSDRRTRWIDALMDFNVGTGSQNSQTCFPGIGPDDLRDSTILRVISSAFLTSGTVSGAHGVQSVEFGFGVISQEAIGAVALPDPVTPGDFPVRGWLYRATEGVSQGAADSQIVFPIRVNVKSQRKLDTGQLILIANSTAIIGTAFTVRVRGFVRTLVLLP